jgi:hypothetical protein
LEGQERQEAEKGEIWKRNTEEQKHTRRQKKNLSSLLLVPLLQAVPWMHTNLSWPKYIRAPAKDIPARNEDAEKLPCS